MPHRDSISAIPRTPKSPSGAYTGEPVPYKPYSPGRYQKSKTRILSTLLLFVTVLGGILWFFPRLFLLPGATIVHTRPSLSGWWRSSSSDSKPFVPAFPKYEMTFKDNYVFQQKGRAADRAWETMFPHSGGSIAVKNPRDFGLPPSFPAPDEAGNNASDTEIYEVSVIRQLGCLVSCRQPWEGSSFLRARPYLKKWLFANVPKTLLRRILIDYEDNVAPQPHTQAHAFHCLDHGWSPVLTMISLGFHS